MTLNNYPLLFDAHHSQHNEDLPFWQNLASLQGNPILELGCGSGRVYIHLIQAGFRVYGLDRDASMLDFLKQQCPIDLSNRLFLMQGDMRAYILELKFPLIICPCNTFTMLTSKERLTSLQRTYQQLTPNGIFAVALPNPHILRNLPPQPQPELEEIFTHPLSGNPVQVSAAWKSSKDYLVVDWFYDHLLPDGHIERTKMRIHHDLSPSENILREMNLANLSIVEKYGDFDGTQYDEDSPHLIVVAQKNGGNQKLTR
jgi:SAM-dependent methyltransferase